jgi:hypothetical protein
MLWATATALGSAVAGALWGKLGGSGVFALAAAISLLAWCWLRFFCLQKTAAVAAAPRAV